MSERKIHPVCKGCGKPRFRGSPDFYHQDGTPRQKCKACVYREAQAWCAANPEKRKALYQRNNHKANIEKRFGLTVDQFEILFAACDGVCLICRNPESRDRRLSLDHDHATGALRGFLCSRCNLLLGGVKDDPNVLEQAAKYLRAKRDLRDLLDPAIEGQTPIPVLLWCPECRTRHIDEGVFATRSHHTHSCQGCGLTWRPAIVCTVGVRFLPGFKNDAPPLGGRTGAG